MYARTIWFSEKQGPANENPLSPMTFYPDLEASLYKELIRSHFPRHSLHRTMHVPPLSLCVASQCPGEAAGPLALCPRQVTLETQASSLESRRDGGHVRGAISSLEWGVLTEDGASGWGGLRAGRWGQDSGVHCDVSGTEGPGLSLALAVGSCWRAVGQSLA